MANSFAYSACCSLRFAARCFLMANLWRLRWNHTNTKVQHFKSKRSSFPNDLFFVSYAHWGQFTVINRLQNHKKILLFHKFTTWPVIQRTDHWTIFVGDFKSYNYLQRQRSHKTLNFRFLIFWFRLSFFQREGSFDHEITNVIFLWQIKQFPNFRSSFRSQPTRDSMVGQTRYILKWNESQMLLISHNYFSLTSVTNEFTIFITKINSW